MRKQLLRLFFWVGKEDGTVGVLSRPFHTSEGRFLNCQMGGLSHIHIPPHSAPPSLSVALQTLAALVIDSLW